MRSPHGNKKQPLSMENQRQRAFQAPYLQYNLSGALKIVMDDGTRFEGKAGHASLLPGRAPCQECDPIIFMT
jgi:hypothetical protein